MTVTRIWQAGAELQHRNECEELNGYGASGGIVVSNTKARTGAYSFRATTGTPLGKAVSTTQIRAGAFVNHNALSANGVAGLLCVMTDNATALSNIRWSQSGDALDMRVNGATVATTTASAVGFATTDQWYHIGITYYAHASSGFFSFYLDGVQKLTYTGNTGTAITGCYFGAGFGIGNAGWSSWAYFDNFYVDDAVGEADAAPPSPLFSFLLPNGAGNYTNWNVNTGSNYAAVDDSGAPDDETTYVYATSSGVQDSYALTNTTAGVTVPAGYAIDAVIPIAWARKTDAGTASTLKLGTRLSSTDAVGSAQTLTTSFGPVWERQTTDPSAGAWSEADVDALEVLIESAGAY